MHHDSMTSFPQASPPLDLLTATFSIVGQCYGKCDTLIVDLDETFESLRAAIMDLLDLPRWESIKVRWSGQSVWDFDNLRETNESSFEVTLRLMRARGGEDTIQCNLVGQP